MTVTVADFRTNFPEFSDTNRYPAASVDFWLTFATNTVANGRRWGKNLDMGVQLFLAHHLVLERRAQDEAARGKVPGMSPGLVNNRSVDKVSVGYDTSGGAEEKAGHWNLTIYGTRYIAMARLVGMGPLQVGAGCGPGGGAWPGPWTSNFPNQNG